MSPKTQPPLPKPVSIPINWDRHDTPAPTPANLYVVQARPHEVVLTFAFVMPLLTGTPQEQAEQASQLSAQGGVKPTNIARVVLSPLVAGQLLETLKEQLAAQERKP